MKTSKVLALELKKYIKKTMPSSGYQLYSRDIQLEYNSDSSYPMHGVELKVKVPNTNFMVYWTYRVFPQQGVTEGEIHFSPQTKDRRDKIQYMDLSQGPCLTGASSTKEMLLLFRFIVELAEKFDVDLMWTECACPKRSRLYLLAAKRCGKKAEAGRADGKIVITIK